MTTFSIDMAEVTRLTRAGRLSEAVALLQGRPAAEAPRAGPPEATGDAAQPTLDLAAPSRPGGAWTAPDLGSEPAGAPDRSLAETLRAVRARFAKAGARSPREIPVPEGARFEARTFANEVGRRDYKVYVPSGYAGQALPVVVMLHGCTQSPDDFAAGTRMNALAEAQTFLVVYPAQSQSANAQRCWNWFNVADQRREGGEPALIAGIAREVLREFSGDPTRVYVAGLSAGGAAAAVLAATYPDLFAAVGIHSGLPCGAAEDVPSAFAAMRGGGQVRPPGAGAPVPTIVFHGDADRTVNPINADRIVAQAAPGAPANVTRGTAGGTAYTRSVRSDASGRAVLEQWVLHGAGHAWSGGSPDGSYTDPRGPDASGEMVRFFMAHVSTAPTKARGPIPH